MRTKVYGKRTKGLLAERRDPFGQESPKLVASAETRFGEHLGPLQEKTGNVGRVNVGERGINEARKKHTKNKKEGGCKAGEIVKTGCPLDASTRPEVVKEKDKAFRTSIDTGRGVVSIPPLSYPTTPAVQERLEQSTRNFSGQSQKARSTAGSLARREESHKDDNQIARSRIMPDLDDISILFERKLVVSVSKKHRSTNHMSNIQSPQDVVLTNSEQPAPLDANTKSYLMPLLGCKTVGQMVEIFQAWLDDRISFLDVRKIGEGSFGEVYRATSNDNDTVVMKIIPLNARKGRGSRSFTSIEAASNELQLLEKMQKVPGFVEFRGACVLRGHMPWQLVQRWNEFKAEGRTVESKDPNKKISYPDDQLWLLIEMSDAGTNLEPGHYRPPALQDRMLGHKYVSVQRTWDIYWQIVRALAKAEVFNKFEHRDLHLGNICASDTRSQHDDEDLSLVPRENAKPLSLDHTGVQVTIIDYSLARASVGEDKVLCYDFMRNDSLLQGEGDLQYDIYRHMAEELGKKRCAEFEPKTNVLWLSYLVTKLLEVTVELSDEARHERDGYITRTAKMRAILDKVKESLRLEERHAWQVSSAGDLLDFGTRRSWFSAEEILVG